MLDRWLMALRSAHFSQLLKLSDIICLFSSWKKCFPVRYARLVRTLALAKPNAVYPFPNLMLLVDPTLVPSSLLKRSAVRETKCVEPARRSFLYDGTRLKAQRN